MMDDYYPFGLTFNSFKREDNRENKYLYNDGSERITDLDLQVDMTKFRVLDPAIGRWWQVDPRANELENYTPYNYSFNNPIRYNDPLGDCPPENPNCEDRSGRDPQAEAIEKSINKLANTIDGMIDNVVALFSSSSSEGTTNSTGTEFDQKVGEVMESSDGAGAMETERTAEKITGVINVDGMTSSAKSKSASSNDPSMSIANMLGSIFESASNIFSSEESVVGVTKVYRAGGEGDTTRIYTRWNHIRKSYDEGNNRVHVEDGDTLRIPLK